MNNFFSNRIEYPDESPLSIGIFHLITLLRHPVHRFISEYEGVKKGENNKSPNTINACNNIDIVLKSNCSSSANVKIDEFIECENNLAKMKIIKSENNLD